jgi:hypothetical protein
MDAVSIRAAARGSIQGLYRKPGHPVNDFPVVCTKLVYILEDRAGQAADPAVSIPISLFPDP